jgi:GntR family carbon starvation induced transcriptional regulator
LRRFDEQHRLDDEQGSEPKTLVETAYRKLRQDILAGRHPPGAKLRAEHLKEEYGVGAGTLREAMALLVSDALVVVQGQRGFRVAPISLQDFRDLTDTRVLLEVSALKQSIALGDDPWEGALLSAFHQLARVEERIGSQAAPNFGEYEEKNQLFHQALIGACPSRWKHHFIAIMFHQSERYRRLALTFHPVVRDTHSEHEAILKAALARDQDLAGALLANHTRATYDAVAKLPPEFFENPYPESD